MTYVAQANLVPLLIALLVGMIVGWWMFRGARRGARPDAGDAAKPPPAPARRDGREGNRLQDEVAAATTDVAGEIIGVRAHAELPGASGPPNDLQMLKGVWVMLAATLNAT